MRCADRFGCLLLILVAFAFLQIRPAVAQAVPNNTPFTTGEILARMRSTSEYRWDGKSAAVPLASLPLTFASSCERSRRTEGSL